MKKSRPFIIGRYITQEDLTGFMVKAFKFEALMGIIKHRGGPNRYGLLDSDYFSLMSKEEQAKHLDTRVTLIFCLVNELPLAKQGDLQELRLLLESNPTILDLVDNPSEFKAEMTRLFLEKPELRKFIPYIESAVETIKQHSKAEGQQFIKAFYQLLSPFKAVPYLVIRKDAVSAHFDLEIDASIEDIKAQWPAFEQLQKGLEVKNFRYKPKISEHLELIGSKDLKDVEVIDRLWGETDPEAENQVLSERDRKGLNLLRTRRARLKKRKLV